MKIEKMVSNCGFGACPTIADGDDGNVYIIGNQVDRSKLPQELISKIAPKETIVSMPKEVFKKLLDEARGRV